MSREPWVCVLALASLSLASLTACITENTGTLAPDARLPEDSSAGDVADGAADTSVVGADVAPVCTFDDPASKLDDCVFAP